MRIATAQFLVLWSSIPLCAQKERVFTGDSTLTWEQTIRTYRELDSRYDQARLMVIGEDDDGSPIHLFVISDGGFTPDSVRATGRNILWITNAIHPGEPDGVDASLMLARALLEDEGRKSLIGHTAVCIVPMYNVSGARTRIHPTRPDQNGPMEHGIRANARNLDLNRDFVKMDAMNTRALIGALRQWDPDVYFETHVSDGADHQYVMELLTTQKDRLSPPLAAFMTGTLEPELYQWMTDRKMPTCPYFETMKDVPEEGLMAFYDAPRYSTGFNALFDRIGILSESHMLKPYADRVNATYQLMLAVLNAMDEHSAGFSLLRKEARRITATAAGFGFNFQLDTSSSQQIAWEGYTATHETSPVSGLPVLGYDHARPTHATVPWFGRYRPSLTITKPAAYLIPAAWREVIDRLEMAGVQLNEMATDSMISAQVYRVDDLHTGEAPFEGHYRHTAVHCSTSMEAVAVHKGDVLVPMGRSTDQFVMNALEPQAEDSYFSWGFFDAILQQKEWFNPYAFEGIAAELLKKDEALRKELEAKRANDPAFAADSWAQLSFIFQRSSWSDRAFRRYPVLRVMR